MANIEAEVSFGEPSQRLFESAKAIRQLIRFSDGHMGEDRFLKIDMPTYDKVKRSYSMIIDADNRPRRLVALSTEKGKEIKHTFNFQYDDEQWLADGDFILHHHSKTGNVIGGKDFIASNLIVAAAIDTSIILDELVARHDRAVKDINGTCGEGE